MTVRGKGDDRKDEKQRTKLRDGGDGFEQLGGQICRATEKLWWDTGKRNETFEED